MRKQGVTISRVYRASPDECARALLTLLEKPIIEEAGRTAPEPDGHDDHESLDKERRGPA
jgi:hypothetical protein